MSEKYLVAGTRVRCWQHHLSYVEVSESINALSGKKSRPLLSAAICIIDIMKINVNILLLMAAKTQWRQLRRDGARLSQLIISICSRYDTSFFTANK